MRASYAEGLGVKTPGPSIMTLVESSCVAEMGPANSPHATA